MPGKKTINHIFNNLQNITLNREYVIPRKRKSYFELASSEKKNLNKLILEHIFSSAKINQLIEDHQIQKKKYFFLNSIVKRIHLTTIKQK